MNRFKNIFNRLKRFLSLKDKRFQRKVLIKRAVIILIAVFIFINVGGMALNDNTENSSFCNSCHIMEPYYESWSQEALLAYKHNEQGVSCQDCHESTISDKARKGFNFLSGNYTLPLTSEVGGRDFCMECHADESTAISWEEIKTATVFGRYNIHDSHEGEQDCSLCHSMHQPSRVTCLECHLINMGEELDESWN